jgi:hypothetical protein
MLLAACSGGDGGGGAGPRASPIVFEPQQMCDRDFAAAPPDVTVFGADAGDYLADRFSLIAGDFNGDGRDDILVGAPLADGPDNSRENAGEAYIVFGAAEPAAQGDLSQGAAVTVTGAQAGDNLGFAVAAGDVNGDGRDDALVGARFADAGQAPDAGKAYVIFGRPDLSGTADTAAGEEDASISGATTAGFLAYSLATGDVTGDGIDDILLGEAGGDGPGSRPDGAGERQDAGAVRVVSGATDLAGDIDLGAAEPFLIIYGASAGDFVPNDLATGDIDGDGVDEIIVGAPAVDGELREDAGRVYIVPVPGDGGALDLAGDGGWKVMTGGARKDGLGFQVAAADVNGDGIGDVIAGARDADGPDDALNNAGEVHVWLGGDALPRSTDLEDGESDTVIFGSSPGDSLGFSVAAADLNSDGLADILAGAPIADGCAEAAQGAGDAYAVFGRDPVPESARLANRGDLTYLGGGAGDGLGFSVAAADFNGDGRADAVIGALQADGPGDQRPEAGEVYVVFGGEQ